MKRIEPWSILLLAVATVTVDNLVTGRLLRPEPWMIAVPLAIFGIGLLAIGTAIVAAWRERARVMATSPEPAAVWARGARGLRWGALAAVAFSVLVFANCSGSVTSGNQGAMADAADFWSLASMVSLPLLIVLALPALMATIAQGAQTRGARAGAWGTAAVVSSVAVLLVVPVTMAIAFYGGISACYFSTSAGSCAAGFGGIGNVFSLAGIVLLVPYLQMFTCTPRAPEAPGSQLTEISTAGRISPS